jgi:hypothetical protein
LHLAAVASAASLALAGCGGDDDSPDAAATTSAAGPTGAAPTSAAPTSAAPTSASPEPSVTAGSPSGSVVPPSATSTADRTGDPAGEVVKLTDLDAARDGTLETITISTSGPVSGWTLRYVDLLVIDDEPYFVDGNATMELVLRAADPTGDQGFVDAVADPLYPGLPILQEVVLADYLGTEVTFAIGLSREVPFSVSVTDSAFTITFDTEG